MSLKSEPLNQVGGSPKKFTSWDPQNSSKWEESHLHIQTILARSGFPVGLRELQAVGSKSKRNAENR